MDSQEIDVSPERLFRTLITPSEIEIWWQARKAIVMAQNGGFWCASWGKNEDHPDYIMFARMPVFEPPSRLVLNEFEYFAKAGPPSPRQDLRTEFSISPQPESPDASCLTITQSGFLPAGDPEADEFYSSCVAGWRTTLEAIDEFFQVK